MDAAIRVFDEVVNEFTNVLYFVLVLVKGPDYLLRKKKTPIRSAPNLSVISYAER